MNRLNKMFQEKQWSLGLPVIPPTPEAVAAMLKGTTRQPGEVVWIVPPRMGQLTVELRRHARGHGGMQAGAYARPSGDRQGHQPPRL